MRDSFKIDFIYVKQAILTLMNKSGFIFII